MNTASSIPLPKLTVSGSPRAMGRAHGEALRETIEAFVRQRQAAARAYLMERKIPSRAFLDAGARCAAMQAGWDPEGYEEHCGIAEGANIEPDLLYATSNMTDVRDVIAYGEQSADAEGCSTLLVPPALAADGQVIAGQTWDLNPEDIDYVVAIHRKPSNGPETWTVTCAGCLTLMGMNEHGLALGTNNIKIAPTRVGVGYLSLLHRAIRCRNEREARDVIRKASRAAAHVYWLADAQRASELECSADSMVVRELKDRALSRTNHCLADAHIAKEGEPPIASSYARIERLDTLLASGEHDLDALRRIFSDRSEGVNSISRLADDGQGTATNACMIAFPARRELWACKGPAQHGSWEQLAFDRPDKA